eukprot:symbB.v1.2.026388.t1/scaffold2559.1/size125745/7
MVFASKSHCPKCGTPKPRSNAAFSRSHVGVSTGTAVPTSLGLATTPTATTGTAVPNAVVAAQLLQYGLPLPYLPMTSQLGVTSFPTVGSLATQTDGLTGGLSRPGDWQCPNEACVNHKRLVFAKKDQCPQCGSARPGRGGANPQDWQCPNAECQNHRNYVFAKHEMCPRCGSARDLSLGRPRSRSLVGLDLPSSNHCWRKTEEHLAPLGHGACAWQLPLAVMSGSETAALLNMTVCQPRWDSFRVSIPILKPNCQPAKFSDLPTSPSLLRVRLLRQMRSRPP